MKSNNLYKLAAVVLGTLVAFGSHHREHAKCHDISHNWSENQPTTEKDLVQKLCEEFGVSEKLVRAVIKQESHGKFVISYKGAIGPMQLMPSTAKMLGVNPYNVQDNLRGGISYLAKQLQRFKKPELALAAYNAGPGAVLKHNGIPPYKETQKYVYNIMLDVNS